MLNLCKLYPYCYWDDDISDEYQPNVNFGGQIVKVNTNMYFFANLKMTINFPPLLTLFFLLYDMIVLLFLLFHNDK